MIILFHFPDSPEFLRRPGQLAGEAGQEVLLECLAQSNPAPEYKWFRNGNLETVMAILKKNCAMFSST